MFSFSAMRASDTATLSTRGRVGRRKNFLSVTVTAPTAALADALSTAFFVGGVENSLRYCDNHPEIGAIFVRPPRRGRTLELLLCGIPEEVLFFERKRRGGGVSSCVTTGD